MFCSLDTKFASMIVRNIDDGIFKQIKDESEYLEQYSIIKKSKINPKFILKHYFVAEFTEWCPH